MLNKSIVKFSIKQTVFINIIFIILIVGGVFSLLTTPVENMPKVELGEVFISTVYFGASAEDIEKLVTKKIEDAIDGLESVEYVQSKAYRNFSVIKVKFIDDTDYRHLYDELRLRVLNIKNDLPDGADQPKFIYLDTNIWLPVVVVNLTGDVPQNSLKLYADELKTKIMNIPDIQSVTLEGEFKKEFHVSVDPQKLRKYGISFSEVSAAVSTANLKIPAGSYQDSLSEYMLETGSVLSSQFDVLNIVVRKDGEGSYVRVSDIVVNARVTHRKPDFIPSINGQTALRLWVVKSDGGNAVQLSEQVKETALKFKEKYSKDSIDVVFSNDSTLEIDDSVDTLKENLIIGMILVTLVLWLTLGFRNALITALGIPFSFLFCILIMKINSVSINNISLVSFVLVTGIIVDDAIIIMENIFRHIQMGKDIQDAVVDGTSEVMLPVISSVLTTILAFIPMLIMTGMVGDFFAVIPKTVSFALAASLIEALFILPIHVIDWGPKKNNITRKYVSEEENPYHHLETGLFSFFWKFYRPFVTICLNHKIISLFLAFLLFIGSAIVLIGSATGKLPLIKVEFFPGNYYRYHVAITMPQGTPVYETDKLVKQVSQLIMSIGENQAQSAAGLAGRYEDEDFVRHLGHNMGEVIVTLPKDEFRNFPENPGNDPMKHLDYIRGRITNYLEIQFPVYTARPQFKVFSEISGPPAGKPVNIRINAISVELVEEVTEKVITFMKEAPELQDLMDLTDDRAAFHKTLKFSVINEKAYQYGLKPGDITQIIAGTLNGIPAGKFRIFDDEIDLKVRLARTDDAVNSENVGLKNPSDILDIPVIEHSSSPVYLRDLAISEYSLEPGMKTRYNGKPSVTISAGIKTASKLSAVRVKNIVEEYFKKSSDNFPGVSISFGGEFESTRKSYRSLTFAFFIAILGIYLVLATQFKSYYQPFMIISAVPFSLIGVVVGLFFTQTTFTMGSFLAVIGLAGVAVNDSLILVDFMNKRLLKGRSIRDAVLEGCAARMRPVIITTVTTILGLLPMAIGIPSKSITWAPMAITFVSGLGSATFLALLIIPVEFELFSKLGKDHK
jgi:multidrug efflux pump subunit AcrB